MSRVGAVLRRDVRIHLSYPFQIVTQLGGIGFSLFTLFFLGRLVGSSEYLSDYEGGYFEFALIGIVVLILAGAALRAFTDGLQAESRNGTFEILLASPVPLRVLVAGWMTWPLILATLEGGLSFAIGWVIARDSFNASGFLPALVPFLLTVASFLATGLIAGAFTVVTNTSLSPARVAAPAPAARVLQSACRRSAVPGRPVEGPNRLSVITAAPRAHLLCCSMRPTPPSPVAADDVLSRFP